MKNLIILFLVIGAVVSQVVLTTGTATAAIEWTLTYATPTGENFYGYTLQVKAKDLSNAAMSTDASNAEFFGVVCLETTSTFDHATPGPGWGWSMTSTGSAASTLGTVAGFATLTLTYFPLLDINEGAGTEGIGAGNTGATNTVCSVASTSAGVATTGVANSVEFVTTAINSCGNLKASGVAFYAKCYNVAAQTAPWSGTSTVTLTAINTGTNVTVSATATTCSTTTGASTLATGATILAGIAYLQF
jgi:hypothetical protein